MSSPSYNAKPKQHAVLLQNLVMYAKNNAKPDKTKACFRHVTRSGKWIWHDYSMSQEPGSACMEPSYIKT